MSRPGVARRGFGEGSIYCRADGRWVSYLRTADGRKKFFTGTTREVVKDRLQEAQRQAHAGQLVVGRDQALAQYLERWLDEAVRHSVRPKTYMDYDLCVRRLVPHIGRVRLKALADHFVWLAIDSERTENTDFLTRFPTTVLPTLWVIDSATEKPTLKWVGGLSS